MALTRKFPREPFQLKLNADLRQRIKAIGDLEEVSDASVVRDIFATQIDAFEGNPKLVAESSAPGLLAVPEILQVMETAEFRARVRALAVRAGAKSTMSDVMRAMLYRGIDARENKTPSSSV